MEARDTIHQQKAIKAVLSFSELMPEPSEFHLSKLGTEIRLEPVSQLNQNWFWDTYKDEAASIFSEIRVPELCTLAIRFMHPEDRKYFRPQKVTFQNPETGEEYEETIGGAKLLMHCILSQKELTALYEAITKAWGLGLPVLEKLSNSLAAEKKRLDQIMREKSETSQILSTGDGSSTSSPINTDGHSDKSAT